jgi:hypothetical protein
MLRFQSPPSSVFPKVPVKEPLPVSPKGSLWRDFPVSRIFFYMSLEFLIKCLLIKKEFDPSLEDPRKAASPMSPTTGPLWKETPISRVVLNISFGISSKGAFATGSPVQLPQRDMIHFQSPSSFIFQRPRDTRPFSVSPDPSGSPYYNLQIQ